MNSFNTRTAAAALALVTLTPTAHTQITYRITDLGNPAGHPNNVSALHINDSGGIVGHSQGFNFRATSFAPGSPTVLPAPGSGGNTFAYASNNNGIVVGSVTVSGSNAPTAWVPSGSGFTRVTLAGLGRLNDINSSNVAIGSLGAQLIAWDPAASPIALSTVGLAGGSNVLGINSSGHIVGFSNVLGVGPVGVRWSSTSAAPSTFRAFGQHTYFTDVNDAATAAGYYSDTPSTVRSIIWRAADLDPITIANPTGAASAYAQAINSSEQVVGFANGSFGQRAFLWDAVSGTRYLNDLIDPTTPGWILTNAYSINGSGVIVGQGTFNGQRRAFRADPVPEPATMTALALGAALLATRRKRK